MTTRTNRLKGTSFESNTKYGWNGTPTQGTTALSTTEKHSGTYSLKYTATGATANRVKSSSGAGFTSEFPSLTAGATQTGSVWVMAPAGTAGATATLTVSKINTSGTTTTSLGTSTGVTLAAGVWTRLSLTTVGGIAAGESMELAVRMDIAIGAVYYVDDAMLEETSTLGTFFDGASVNSGFTYAWLGTAYQSASTEDVATSTTINAAFSGTGSLTASLRRNIAAALSGSGTLTAILRRNIAVPLSGTGTLTATLHRYISAGFTGSGTLTAELVVPSATTIDADFTGSGSLTAVLQRHIAANFGGAGSLTATLTTYHVIEALLGGTGTLTATLSSGTTPERTITVSLSGEGVLTAELIYTARPTPEALQHLRALSTYTVSTAAVPLSPDDSSGATPNVTATYIAGVDPEYAMGQTQALKNNRVGNYSGEIVNVSVAKSSDRVTVSITTPLTLLNSTRRIFPFIAEAESVNVPAQAVDYMTQACGFTYDTVPGDLVMYASGYGHAAGYLAGHDDTRYTGTAKTFTTVSGRTVQLLTGTSTLVQEPAPALPPAVMLREGKRLVFSAGMGLRGTGRTGRVVFNMADVNGAYAVTLEGTSAGTVTARIGSVTLGTYAGTPGDYRATLSIEKTSAATVASKLTIHRAGVLEHDGPPSAVSYNLPRALGLANVQHIDTGAGSGSSLYVYGTYLSMADKHPAVAPAVQKSLAAANRATRFVSGFNDNVWAMLNQYASIHRMDIRFIDGRLVFGQRVTDVTRNVDLGTMQVKSTRRDKYRKVAVMNQRSKPVSDGTGLLWRADNVIQVATREIHETTIITPHSVLDVQDPVPVTGISPFPYLGGTGQYVVTGADGSIISPAWWTANGGSVTVSVTDHPGELLLTVRGPDAENLTQSPYRLAQGAGDRPALYICGSGVLNDPVLVEVATGASNAKAGYDGVFDSPFICDSNATYDTAAAMARQYSSAVADVDLDEANQYDTPSKFGQYPASGLFTDGDRNFRVTTASLMKSSASLTAEPFTTLGAFIASFPAGSTIADITARFRGRTIREMNIKPLKKE